MCGMICIKGRTVVTTFCLFVAEKDAAMGRPLLDLQPHSRTLLGGYYQ